MINFKTVIRIIGILLLLETVMLLLCSGVSFYYQDEALVDFWVSASITAGVPDYSWQPWAKAVTAN
jgi:trk system potassium uptake protein TrkH